MLFSFIVDFMKSIKEIADELNVSKTAVRKKIANLGIGNQFAKIGNQFAINEEQEKLIKSAFLEKQSETKSETSSRTGSRTVGNQFAINEQELLAKNELIEALRNQIASQQEQIENQHEMIVRQQDSISRLTEALESTTRSLEASQALHAGTMQAQIEEKKERWKFWKRK